MSGTLTTVLVHDPAAVVIEEVVANQRHLYLNRHLLMIIVAVYGIPGKTGILDIALYGISGIHGSRYNPLRPPLPDVGIAGMLYHPSLAA